MNATGKAGSKNPHHARVPFLNIQVKRKNAPGQMFLLIMEIYLKSLYPHIKEVIG